MLLQQFWPIFSMMIKNILKPQRMSEIDNNLAENLDTYFKHVVYILLFANVI